MALLHDILLYIWAPEELFLWLKHRKQVHHFSKILWKLHAAFLGVLQGTWVFCSFQKYFCSQLKSLPPSTFCYLFYLIFQNNIAQASGMALGYSCTIMNLSAGETDPPPPRRPGKYSSPRDNVWELPCEEAPNCQHMCPKNRNWKAKGNIIHEEALLGSSAEQIHCMILVLKLCGKESV